MLMRSDQRGKPAQTPEIVVVRPEQAPLHRITIWRALQVPVQHWYELIADPTIADAVLDRLVHTAHRLALDGPSMRNPNAARAEVTPPEIAVANTKSAKGAMK